MSSGDKSALIDQISRLLTPCSMEVRIPNLCRIPVPSGESAATSMRSSRRSAIPFAAFQFVLSSKSEMYGLRNTHTPPIIETTIASIIMTPKTSLTAATSGSLRSLFLSRLLGAMVCSCSGIIYALT